MADRLEGKIAVVTGAGQGIGRGIAIRFAAEGAKVIVGTRTTSHGEKTVELIRKSGGEATLITADMGDKDQATRLVMDGLEVYGGLDILVHNAGVFPYVPFEQLSDEQLNNTMAVNLMACFWLTKAALPALKKARGGGRVLMTSSAVGNHTSVACLTHYAASKAGVNGFVRNLAVELAPLGITVNAVEPGLTLTENHIERLPAEAIAAMTSRIPSQRAGTPEDIAAAMLFLASSESSYITGRTIVVDGGLTLPDITQVAAAETAAS